MRQLDLFSPDQESLRHGCRLIECLELVEAIALFEGLGKMFEDLGDVVDDSLSMCRYWFEVEEKPRVVSVWKHPADRIPT